MTVSIKIAIFCALRHATDALNNMPPRLELTMQMAPSKTFSVVLNNGTMTSLKMEEGDTLHVTKGSVTISEPGRWLGDQFVRWEHMYSQGAVHIANQSGEFKIFADEEKTVMEYRRIGTTNYSVPLFEHLSRLLKYRAPARPPSCS